MRLFGFKQLVLSALIFGATSQAQSRWGDDGDDLSGFDSADAEDDSLEFDQGDQIIIEQNDEDDWDDQDYVRPGDNYEDNIYIFEDDPEMVPANTFEAILHDMNECGLNIIYKYDIHDEVKYFFDEIQKPQYFEVLENGTHEEILQYIALILDPLAQKVFGAPGSIVFEILSPEMVEWIKDSSILWIKNMGQPEQDLSNFGNEDEGEQPVYVTEECQSLDALVQEYRALILRHEETILQQAEQIEEQANDLQGYLSQIEEQQAYIAALESNYSTQSDELAELQEVHEGVADKLADAQQQNAELIAKIEELSRSLPDCTADLEQCQFQQTRDADTIEGLTDEVDTLGASHEDCKAALAECESQGGAECTTGDTTTASPFLEDDIDQSYICAKTQSSSCPCDGVAVYGPKWTVERGQQTKTSLEEVLRGEHGEYALRPVQGEIECSDDEFGAVVSGHQKQCWCIPAEEDESVVIEIDEAKNDESIDVTCDQCSPDRLLGRYTLELISDCPTRTSEDISQYGFKYDYIQWKNYEQYLEGAFGEESCELAAWTNERPEALEYDEDATWVDGEHGPWDADYRGSLSFTKEGDVCQAWESQDPHIHPYSPEAYPFAGLEGNNFCRNPDWDDNGAWCYTTDPGNRWAYCDTTMNEEAKPDRQDGHDGYDYYNGDDAGGQDYYDSGYYNSSFEGTGEYDPYAAGWFYNYYYDCNYWYDYYYYCDVGYYDLSTGQYWYDDQVEAYNDAGGTYNAYSEDAGQDHEDDYCNYYYDDDYYCAIGWYDEQYGEYWYDGQLYGTYDVSYGYYDYYTYYDYYQYYSAYYDYYYDFYDAYDAYGYTEDTYWGDYYDAYYSYDAWWWW